MWARGHMTTLVLGSGRCGVGEVWCEVHDLWNSEVEREKVAREGYPRNKKAREEEEGREKRDEDFAERSVFPRHGLQGECGLVCVAAVSLSSVTRIRGDR